MSYENLFIKKVQKLFPIMFKLKSKDECWTWIQPRASMTTKVGDKLVSTTLRRISYAAFVGEIPEYHEVKMTCRNKKCVNPAHMETRVSIRQITASLTDEPAEEVQS